MVIVSMLLGFALMCLFSPVSSHLPRHGMSPFTQSGWNDFYPNWSNPWPIQSGFGTTFDMMNRFVSPIISWNTRGRSRRPDIWANTWANGDPFNDFTALQMPNNRNLRSPTNTILPLTNTFEDRFVVSPTAGNLIPGINQFPGANGVINQFPGANGAINQFPRANGAINPFPGANGAINQFPRVNGALNQFPGTNDAINQLPVSGGAEWNNGVSGLPTRGMNSNPAISSGSAMVSPWSVPPRNAGIVIPGVQNNGLQWSRQGRNWKK